MKDIFISYARIDIKQANRIFEVVRLCGYSVWFDKRDLIFGLPWEREISEAIQNSSITFILISSRSWNSDGYQKREIEMALQQQGAPRGHMSFQIVPMLLDDCPIPSELAHLQHFTWEGNESEQKLIKYLSSTLWPSSLERFYNSYVPKIRSDRHLIVPGYGAATVMLRDRMEDVHNLLGEAEDTLEAYSIVGTWLCYYRMGVEILLQYRGVAEINLYGEDHNRHYPFNGYTPEGISFNSTKREIENAYGRPDRTSSSTEGIASIYSKLGIIFLFETYKVRDLDIKPSRLHIIPTEQSI